MEKIAFLFPGQGSQEVGMGKLFKEETVESARIFAAADERLGFPLSDLILHGPSERLTLTENAQPAILTASIASLKATEDYDLSADYVAGHSLGEYSALVCAGALSFEDAVYAVHQRGLLMEEAVPAGKGAMSAVLGLDKEMLQSIAEQVTVDGEPVQLANLNAPGQIVISGSKKGVDLASEMAKEKGAKRVLPLAVSGPFHSQLMEPAAERFKSVLNEISIQDARIPLIANVTADQVQSADDIYKNLVAQLYSSVRWEETVRRLIDLGVDTFVEIGPGRVLSGLVKRINRRAKTFAIHDPESLYQVANDLHE